MKQSYKETVFNLAAKAKASRLSFGEELAALGDMNHRIVALDADLCKSTRTDLFAAKFPNRFFEMGIAEANMIGVAAGLANSGKIPYCASFGCFLTGRYDQIRMSVSFTGANVRLVGTHSGVGIGEDGHSQMALEDLGLMRGLPNMTVFQPADDSDTRNFMRWSVDHQGPCYVRLTRQNLPEIRISPSYKFAPGNWQTLADFTNDSKLVIIATGGVVPAAVDAADVLSEKIVGPIGIINANWINPIDTKMIMQIIGIKPKLIVTVEDHYRVGGLGSAVSEVLSNAGNAPKLLRLGVEGFGQSGTPEDNYQHYGFTGVEIAKRILSEF